MPRSRKCHAGFGFVGPTCKSRAGLGPSPPDQAGSPEQDLESESAWRSVPQKSLKTTFSTPLIAETAVGRKLHFPLTAWDVATATRFVR